MQRILQRLMWLGAFVLLVAMAHAGEPDLALAIVYDTSGSMAEPVPDKSGGRTPKYEVANRALESIVTRLEKFTVGGRKLNVALYTFGERGGRESVKLAPFQAATIRDWLAHFGKPQGGTPLGTAVNDAASALLAAPAGARHVLTITDGQNTSGPPPEAFLPKLQDQAVKQGTPIYFHFVAFDVDAKVFAGVKKAGATLVSAADESQLNDKLGFILEEKILLEKE